MSQSVGLRNIVCFALGSFEKVQIRESHKGRKRLVYPLSRLTHDYFSWPGFADFDFVSRPRLHPFRPIWLRKLRPSHSLNDPIPKADWGQGMYRSFLVSLVTKTWHWFYASFTRETRLSYEKEVYGQ